MVKNISTRELVELLETQADLIELIDVREESEFAGARIQGAKLIPMNLMMGRLDEIDWTKKVVLYCRTGARSMYVATIMGGERNVWNLAGGIVDFYRNGGEKFVARN